MPARRKQPEPLSPADEVIIFIETNCRVPEGRDVGKPLKLREWQRHNIRLIYDNPAGTRRAIISFGRKNGKTAFAAMLLLAHLCGPRVKPNSQLNSAAQSRDQASILFNLAAKIIRLSPTLLPALVIRDTVREIFCPGLGTIYKALSAEASTAFGLSPAFIVHDELGQVKGSRSPLYEALETAVGAHEQPLSIVISTQAPTDADLLSVLIDDAQAAHDSRVVLSLYSADEKLDAFGEEAIRAANPAFGDFLNATEVLAMAEDARRMPSREAEYRNLVLNQRVEASSPFVSPAMHVKPTFWLPEHELRAKAQHDRVPYDVWARSGALQTTPGKSVEYEFVAEYLRGLFDRLDIRALGFDRWNFRHLKPWLLKAGFSEEEVAEKFVEFGQGMQSMSPALRDLDSDLRNAKIAHGGHPVLTMCARNAVVQSDPAGNRKLTKLKSRGRIDGMVALAMARGVAGSYEAAPELDIAAMIG
jgi:phage terminase large subunit-like protein